jgi:glycosyltransferase involved in cell wall biosynthesis
MKRILWFSEWLPTRVEPYAGDSIERQALAASSYNDITILHVKKDPLMKGWRTEKEIRTYNPYCRAIIHYYPSLYKNIPFIDILASNFYFLYLHVKGIRAYETQNGKPAGVQVNVTLKNGVIALLYKWLKKVPYIVAEGWSLFLPESQPSFWSKPFIFRWAAKKVLRNASRLVTVSDHLGHMLCKNFGITEYVKIPNVVDERIFFPASSPPDTLTFKVIHISLLGYPKNPEALIKAIALVVKSNPNVELRIHGPVKPELHHLVKTLGMEHHIHFLPECPQQDLARSMRECHALILFSRYETFGNVVIEANACGLPAVTSNYPTFRETVADGINGIKAAGPEPDDLAAALLELIRNYPSFDRKQIAEMANASYSYPVIGKQFDTVYRAIFN